jgi:hypothetical protein
VKEKGEKFEGDINAVKEQLQTLYTTKAETKEEYFKTKLEYEIEYDEIRHSEWIANQK